jgi:peroxiredoxin
LEKGGWNEEKKMALQLGDIAPDFEADTTEGRIRLHEWHGGSWGVLFSHLKDFTPICTTELGYMARIKPEFDKRNVKSSGSASTRCRITTSGQTTLRRHRALLRTTP